MSSAGLGPTGPQHEHAWPRVMTTRKLTRSRVALIAWAWFAGAVAGAVAADVMGLDLF